MADIQSGDLIAALDEASLSRYHLRAVVASGVGFFTDAYDLFVIGIASALITKDWNLSPGQLAVLNSTMLAAAFLGAMVFGRYADVVGRKRVYWLVAVLMIAGALGSALSGSFAVLIGFRFLLGLGVGGGAVHVAAVPRGPAAGRAEPGVLAARREGRAALIAVPDICHHGPCYVRRTYHHTAAGRDAIRQRDIQHSPFVHLYVG